METGARLPAELQDYIIDHLHGIKLGSWDRRETLHSCSLVSSRWLKRTRKWLFNNLGPVHVVYGGADYKHQRNVPQLLLLLESPHTTIAKYIKHITIYGPDIASRQVYTNVKKGSPEQYAECSRMLGMVLHHLPHVHSLNLIRVTWNLLSDSAKSLILSMPHVTSLTWKYIPRATISDSLGTACGAFGTRLECLDIDWVHSEGKLPPIPPLRITLPHLHTLRVGARLERTAGSLLLSPESFRAMPALHTLSIRTFEEESLSLLGRVKHLGSQLLHLELDIPVFWSCDISDDKCPFPISLHHNTKLLTLRFTSPIILNKDSWWVSKIIASAPSPNLHVHITVCTRHSISQQALAESDVSALESSITYDHRRVLHVHPDRYSNTSPPWFESTIESLFAELRYCRQVVVHRLEGD
ncbi:hypothetical protein DXG01_001755 [Tephrocybe rancida]|nr:hypothetical protein DXG01_001755 [Tephrocybe rancida]